MFASYQKIYDAVVSKTWESKAAIFGTNENGYGIPNWAALTSE